MNSLYRMLGISKQAVYQFQKSQAVFDAKMECLLFEAEELRQEHPGCGVEKMYDTLMPDFMGRDRFIDVFMNLGYRVKKNKNYIRTTHPVHSEYKNLIEGTWVTGPNQVWQSDITYFFLKDRFYYIVFIIDVYTKLIVGYNVSDSLRADANVKALKMALKEKGDGLEGLIHHSDRGSQYVYKEYVNLLTSNGIKISMGKKAQENAYAERINGTIKNEYLNRWKIDDSKSLRSRVKKAVHHYNDKRIHRNIPGKMTPKEFNEIYVNLKSSERPKVLIPILN